MTGTHNYRSFRLRLATRAALLALVITLALPRPARAQAELVSAQPAPGAVLTTAPAGVRLLFNRPLLKVGTSITVSNDAGARIDLGDGRIDPENPLALVVTLPLLFEGTFTVDYSAALLGSSVTLADKYQFTLDLPDPIVNLVSPRNGQAFQPGPILVRLRTQYIDFAAYNRRMRVYVDGSQAEEFRGLRTQLDGLAPGVHQVRTVLVQLNDQEVSDTSTTVTITVVDSTPGADTRIVSRPTSSSGPPLALSIVVGLILVSILMLAGGYWLGRLEEQDASGGPE